MCFYHIFRHSKKRVAHDIKSRVDNDNIDQCANVINQQNNVNPPTRRLKRRQWKNMSLLSQNIKPCISLTMDAQVFWMASWDAILSPSLVQQGRWIPMGSTDWTQMQWVILKARRWGRPNLIHNAEEKTSKDKQKQIAKLLNTCLQ